MISAGEYITHLIQQQVETANSLINDNTINIDSRVHEVRKAMKRSKAFLKLLRPALPLTLYFTIKNKLRGVKKLLAEYRKHCVYVEIMKTNEKHIKSVADTEIYEELLSVFTDLRDTVLVNVQSLENSFFAVSNQIEQIPLDAVFTKSQKLTLKQTEKVLNKTKVKFQKNILTSNTINSSASSHQWRKSIKLYMYQAKAVTAINERVPVIPLKELDKIGEILGKDHDIAELLDFLAELDFSTKVKEYMPAIKKKLYQQMMSYRKDAVKKTKSLIEQPVLAE